LDKESIDDSTQEISKEPSQNYLSGKVKSKSKAASSKNLIVLGNIDRKIDNFENIQNQKSQDQRDFFEGHDELK